VDKRVRLRFFSRRELFSNFRYQAIIN